MKLFTTIAIGFIAVLSGSVYAESVRVTDENIPFLYESRAEIPPTDQSLAEMLSVDYRKAKDEFTRMELFQKIKPVIDKKLEESKKTEVIKVLVGAKLKEYNFEKNAFPTGFGTNTYIPFDNRYAINFDNANAIEYLKIPLNDAKKLSSILQKSRKVSFEITAVIKKSSEQKVSYKTKKLLTTEITSVEVKANNGKVIYRASF